MALFEVGKQFPPEDSIERIAKYMRGKKIYEGKQWEVYERAYELLKDTPQGEQLRKLYIAVNLVDILVTKPSDLLVGEAPQFESGSSDDSVEQVAVNRIVEENDLVTQMHEVTTASGYRGDSWIKIRYGYRQDFSALTELGVDIPEDAETMPIIEPVTSLVFPEFAKGSTKQLKAVNIAWVEWVETKKSEIPYLNVERHLPGYIIYERYLLQQYEGGVDTQHGVPVQILRIQEKVATGRDNDVVITGVSELLVRHIPYKATDDSLFGTSGIEKIEGLLGAINDRITQIDYILWKHADPTAYGPELESGGSGGARFGGRYIPITKEDPTPGYMTWNAQLDAAFKELDLLIGLVFQMSETPQWLFGTTLAGDNKGGTGTSHTDSGAIKARFMPILSKVKRIRMHVDKAYRDAIWLAMKLENYANEDVDGFESYAPIYPTISWKDGIPRDEKELAEIMQIRTGGKATIDVTSAVKKMDEVDDEKASEIISRIDGDETRVNGFVDGSIFNSESGD
jgi:Phage portal protein, SPP1 Gp6-like